MIDGDRGQFLQERQGCGFPSETGTERTEASAVSKNRVLSIRAKKRGAEHYHLLRFVRQR